MLQKRLGNPKDEVEDFEKTGIYEINCNDCDNKYVGKQEIPIFIIWKKCCSTSFRS